MSVSSQFVSSSGKDVILMIIEQNSETQIQATLNNADMRNWDIEFRDVAYHSEKIKNIF